MGLKIASAATKPSSSLPPSLAAIILLIALILTAGPSIVNLTSFEPFRAAEAQVSRIILNPANGHFYEAIAVPGEITWPDAKIVAEQRTYQGIKGHLATITSQQEQDFIVGAFPQVRAPLTFPYGEGYWLGGFQQPGSSEPDGGWQWVTGEEFSFSKWMPLEPNNNCACEPKEEDSLVFWWYPGDGSGNGELWNDLPRTFLVPGYVVEYEQSLVANAGPDQTVKEDDVVKLDGSGSSGSITSYQWAQVRTGSEPTITLTEDGVNNDDTRTPTSTFTAPKIATKTDFTFKLTVRDNQGQTHDDTVVVTVNNKPPTAADDHYTVLEDTTLAIDAPGVLGNDNYNYGDPLKAIKVSDPTNGIVDLAEDGSFSYVPNNNFHGIDSFRYKNNDGTADSNEATVEIVVDPANDPPTANDDTAETDEDTPVTVEVLANDVDEEDALTVSSSLVSTPSSGTATVNQDNTITYSPNSNFNGQDSFIYEASDGKGGMDTATVTVTVNSVPDIPNKPTITSPQDGAITNDDTPTIEGKGDSAAATTIEVFADGTSLGTTGVDSDSGLWSFTPSSALSDGTHEITATALNDEEGSSSEPSDAVTITIDSQEPTVTGAADREPDNSGFYTESVTVTWQGDDGTDGSGIDSCDDPTTYSGPDGTSIELAAECTDNAGNTGGGTFTLSYDETTPEVTITKAEDDVDDLANGGTTKSNQIEFKFTASDSASGLQSVECRLDGGSFSDCTSPVEYTKLKKGTHTFEVKGTDQVGNVGTDDFTWTIR